MKEPKWKLADEEAVWRYVGWHLAKHGIKTVLVGGAVAAIYSEGAYRSGDLDIVTLSYFDEKIPEIMAKIGFKKRGSRHFIHRQCRVFIDFVNGPVGIGDDLKIKPKAVKVQGQTLFIYSPTDCIRDRLASYIHFRARECLDQAALVAKRFPFNHKKVREWCRDEGAPQAYDELLEKIKG